MKIHFRIPALTAFSSCNLEEDHVVNGRMFPRLIRSLIGVYSIYIIGGGFMERAKIFQSGRSQAVRLPKEFRFNGSEVFVKRVGNAVVLLPMDDAWDSLAQSLDLFSDDFMVEREQPAEQQREEPF
ncbi:type II toxin-antitoxin system antitoxin VapB [Sulfoacidibacillus thermotolerans]|nr:type II toxin-antitoxin system VapB family antitoxin [Sulfoacidibacillus thermotolerans]